MESTGIDTVREVASHPGKHELAASMWDYLAGIDSCVIAPAADSTGSIRGDRLHIQWWIDPSGKYFAVKHSTQWTQVIGRCSMCLWLRTSASQAAV